MVDNEEGFIKPQNPPPKDDIVVLGTWVLAWNSYNNMQVLLLLAIAKALQQVSKQVINQNFRSGNIPKSSEQIARQSVYLSLWLSQFGVSPHHYAQLKQSLIGMTKKDICIPMKKGMVTQYIRFPRIFDVSFARDSNHRPYVTLSFPLGVWNMLMASDKGYVHIDLNAVKRMKSLYARKMYISMQSWLNRGVAEVCPGHISQLLKGGNFRYKFYSELENHVLLPAHDELIRLYKHGIIDVFFSYTPYYKDNIKTPQPCNIIFKMQCRADLEGDGTTSEELGCLQERLCLKLRLDYDIQADVAKSLSKRLRLSDTGDLHAWFLHKDDFIKACKMHNKPLKVPGYMVVGLNGFFTDHGC